VGVKGRARGSFISPETKPYLIKFSRINDRTRLLINERIKEATVNIEIVKNGCLYNNYKSNKIKVRSSE
jgi:hypothetical protein